MRFGIIYKQRIIMELEMNDYKLIEFVEIKDDISSAQEPQVEGRLGERFL